MSNNEKKRKACASYDNTAPAGFYPDSIRDVSGEHGYALSLWADSVSVFAGMKPGPKNEKHDTAQDVWERAETNDQWSGGISRLDTWGDAASEGWPEGVERMRKALEALAPKRAQSIRRRRVRGPEGDDLDIHRVYGGTLDTAWDRMAPRPVSGSPIVRIWVEISALASVSADKMFWRGAAALAVTEALEAAGYRVEVIAYAQSNNVVKGKENQDCFTAFTAKESNQPLDVAKLAFLTAHPATFRVAGFAFRLCSHEAVTYGIGRSNHTRPTYAEDADLVSNGVFSKEAAQNWINASMARFI